MKASLTTSDMKYRARDGVNLSVSPLDHRSFFFDQRVLIVSIESRQNLSGSSPRLRAGTGLK